MSQFSLMMKMLFFYLFFFGSCLQSCSHSQIIKQNWKERSQKLAHDYALSEGQYNPEYISDLGFDQFDSKGTSYSENFDKELSHHWLKWRDHLTRMLLYENDEQLCIDIKILLDQLSLQMERIELEKKRGVIPFIPVTEYIFLNLKELINKASNKKKMLSGSKRFKSYINGEHGKLSLVSGVMAYMQGHMNNLSHHTQGIWPTKKELEIYLKESVNYQDAIKNLLKNFPRKDWISDFNQLQKQDELYRQFLKLKVLPHGRTSPKIPREMYVLNLKDYGIEASPEDLIKNGKKDYQKTYEQFISLAKELAVSLKLSKNDPVFVVNYLRKQKINHGQKLLAFYKKTLYEIFEIIRSHRPISLSEIPPILIRFATKAEAQSLPAPHFISSPLLGNGPSKIAQFVITPPDGGRDDFSYPEAILTLTAHEALPGHGLQYQVIKDRGTTLMRAGIASNSANVEGWALYAEDIVFPYLTKQAQFITLQRRLWRQARMFLDPQLNLGLIDTQRIKDVFTKELGFSELFSQSEMDRYSYIIPGQAPSYYYGLKIIQDAKSEWKKRDDGFYERCFNDALLSLGILPLKEVSIRLKKMKCTDN
jgi:hypothetical protein